MQISILDCTLRDGGYINNWDFKSEHIIKILQSLNSAKINVVELGYLKDAAKIGGGTLFPSVKSLNSFSSLLHFAKKVVMINLGDYSIENLEANQGIIDGIRLAFHKKDLQIALLYAKEIKNMGYELYFQPMVSKNYSDIEFLQMIEQVNVLCPYAFYIVDSFGSMGLKEFNHYLDITENNLSTSIKLGYHSHNNMQLAFCNAIKMCETNLSHDILLDSSIYGIGRGAGNLNTELITNFLNKEYNGKYQTFHLLEVIDELLESLMKTKAWGFSPAQYLSAYLDCHPNYATYLIGKNNYHLTKIFEVLQKIPNNKKVSFDKDLIEKLYVESILKTKISAKGDVNFDNCDIFIIASGSSVVTFEKKILTQIKDSKNPCIIALNHKPNNISCDYYLFSNQKRFDAFASKIQKDKIIITNNIETNHHIGYVLDLSLYAFPLNDSLTTNVIGITLNLLIAKGVNVVNIAGLDGYKQGDNNYAYEEYDSAIDFAILQSHNATIEQIMKIVSKKIKIQFITPSIFEV